MVPVVCVQVVWPCLAVVGGLDAGWVLGAECLVEVNGEDVPHTLVSVPDAEERVEVQEQISSSSSSSAAATSTARR